MPAILRRPDSSPSTQRKFLRNIQFNSDMQSKSDARLSDRLAPLWALFLEYGSLRVIATAAELRGLVSSPCLPLPVESLQGEVRQRLGAILDG